MMFSILLNAGLCAMNAAFYFGDHRALFLGAMIFHGLMFIASVISEVRS